MSRSINTQGVQPLTLRPKIREILPLDRPRFGGLLIFRVKVEESVRLTTQVPRSYRVNRLDRRFDPEYRAEVLETIIETFGLNLRLFGGGMTQADLVTLFGIKREEARLLVEYIVSETDRFELSPQRQQILESRLQNITNGLTTAAENALEDLSKLQSGERISGYLTQRGGVLFLRKSGESGQTEHIHRAADLATKLSNHALAAIKTEMELHKRNSPAKGNDGGDSDRLPDGWKETRTTVLEEVVRRVIQIDRKYESAPSLDAGDVIEGVSTRVP